MCLKLLPLMRLGHQRQQLGHVGDVVHRLHRRQVRAGDKALQAQALGL